MGQLIESLASEADIVIFDSPPVLAVTDSVVLSTRVDGVVLLVETGRTRHVQAQRSKEALTKVGAPLLGVVLNRVLVRGENYYRYYDEADDTRHPRRTRFPWRRPELGALRSWLSRHGVRQPSHGSRVVNPQSPRSTSADSQAESVK